MKLDFSLAYTHKQATIPFINKKLKSTLRTKAKQNKSCIYFSKFKYLFKLKKKIFFIFPKNPQVTLK
jgi:hypothetical protein